MPVPAHAARFVAVSMSLAALTGLLAPQAALGQVPATPAAPDKATDSALKGPTVGERPTAKGKPQSGFGPDAVAKKSAANKPSAPLGMAEFLKAIDVLRGAPTPEAARLTTEEDARFKAIAADFATSAKTYMETHKQELDDLRAKLSPNDRNMLDMQLERGGAIKLSKAGFGGKNGVLKKKSKGTGDAQPDAPAAPAQSKDDAAKTRARLVEVYAARPKAEDAQAKILGALTPDQLTIVNEQLAKHDEMSMGRRRGHGQKGKKA